MIPPPSDPGKIELYSPQFYTAWTVGGILSCVLSHMAVTPLDLVKCNMQGPDSEQQSQTRFPLTEKLDMKYSLPRSPLAHSSSNYTSPHILPPLKFYSGLLKPLNTVALSVDNNDNESDYSNDENDYESKAWGLPQMIYAGTDPMKNQRIGSRRDDEETFGEKDDRAPVQHANLVNHVPYYHASGQNAWQALISYDACIRLCLNSWARGCAEAPEFLQDECLLLRNSFGLHNMLLQPQGVHQIERDNKTTEQVMASKVKRSVGKIRVEVKKLRIIPQRKLKDTNSMRGVITYKLGQSMSGMFHQ
ncbi:mitochondrial phosphate carrier protein 3 mitochondrial [Phtheirospermum japonicum]|uniref:Mitochondrial phosphate carrier protein 3 mitochondrial n=1 Tax=Phtheirospermum japonicum TaxID=374723 RepID=A0A830BZ15_9LAMI|nr:mitochondrial phosphate carrier protein 3 mitochondrial [Phtheirospermum japonicum]